MVKILGLQQIVVAIDTGHYRVYIETMIIPIWCRDSEANATLIRIDAAAAADHRSRSGWVLHVLKERLDGAVHDMDRGTLEIGMFVGTAPVAQMLPANASVTAGTQPAQIGYVRLIGD